MNGVPRTVVVTGGAGFAGGYVVRELLDRGYRVVVLDLADFRSETRFVIGSGMAEVTLERGSIDNFPRVLEVVLNTNLGRSLILARSWISIFSTSTRCSR